MTSGNNGASVSVDNTIPENDNLLFEPIPSELLYTYSQKPSV